MSRTHAIVWCGSADPSQRVDFPASLHDIRIATECMAARGIRPEDVHLLLCRPDLVPEGWRGRVALATIDELRSTVQRLSVGASPDDRLLFAATNHADPEGLMTAGPAPDPYEDLVGPVLLTPTQLDRCLELFCGQQIVVVATCFSGKFLTIAGDRRVVFAAGRADEKIYADRDPPGTPFLIRMFQSWAGCSDVGKMSLDAAFTSIAAAPPVTPAGTPQLPLRAGQNPWAANAA